MMSNNRNCGVYMMSQPVLLFRCCYSYTLYNYSVIKCTITSSPTSPPSILPSGSLSLSLIRSIKGNPPFQTSTTRGCCSSTRTVSPTTSTERKESPPGPRPQPMTFGATRTEQPSFYGES